LSNAMSITPKSPAINQQGWVQTWVTSQWKNRPIPGQFSAEINTPYAVTRSIAGFADWSPTAIELRQASMAEIAIKAWPI
ncbi:hypothetical protein, partial [Ollibium composti]|uniref:hypothetical protein n=1 Tax=Ollibium composti TaxID=2675109 RepID=UPI00198230D7